MVWIGKINKKFLKDKSLLDLVRVIKEDKGKLDISVEDSKKDEFVQRAIKSIFGKSYIYLVKDKIMYVIFEDHMFKFSRGYPEIETARSHGESLGIPRSEMNFEEILESY